MYSESLPVPNTVGSSADLSEFMRRGRRGGRRLVRSHTLQLEKRFGGRLHGNVCLSAIHPKGEDISLEIL